MSEEAEIQDSGTGDFAGLPPEAPQETKPNRPAGYDPVDLGDLPEDKARAIEDRFKYLYRQVKDSKREIHHYKNETAARIDELTNGFGTVVNHLQEKTYSETESGLRQQMKTAYESGDTDAYLTAQEKLDDIRIEKKLAAKQPKQESRKQPSQQEYDEGGLDPDDQRVVDSWQDEKDDNGSRIRPWAYNKGTQENPDPEYLAALAETRAVLMSPRFKNATMEQKMAEVDRRMGVQKQTGKQSVMGGGLTGSRKTSKVTLSADAERIAVKTKFGGPSAKTDADHIEAYRSWKEKSSSKKGAR